MRNCFIDSKIFNRFSDLEYFTPVFGPIFSLTDFLSPIYRFSIWSSDYSNFFRLKFLEFLTSIFGPRIFSPTTPDCSVYFPNKILCTNFPTQNFFTHYDNFFNIFRLKIFKPIFRSRIFLLIPIFFTDFPI